MLRAGFLALAAAVMAATAHASVSVTIKNSCSESISLYDNSATTTMAAGASTTRTLANSYVGMFRNGADDEATLAEFSVDSDGTPWYDISIIPPGSTTCTSLSACQSETGVTGFNTAIQIAPQSNTDSTNCETVTCMADGCDDAYQYPTDDDNTHTCPVGTSFVVTFCPGGSGSSSSTTSTPTPTPTSTTATPTPTPTSTTATPTPTPTASASSSGSDSDDSGSSEVAGEAYDGSFSLSNSTSTTKSSASKDTDTGSAGVAEAADTDSATTAATSDDATAAATTDSSGSDDGAVEISTQSSGGGGSTFGIVFASGIAVMGIAAGGFIYAVRQKKKQLDNETKSPGPETSREVSVLMATPGVVL